MKKLIFLLTATLSIPVANAVEADIHEKCLKASDYKGCVEVFSGVIKDQIKPGTQNIKLNIDTQVVADGNQCPSEFAYAGGGYCRRVICEYAGLFGTGHHPDLAGKGMKCHKGLGQMRWGEWDKEKVRASINPDCPDIPLQIGYNSTCESIVHFPRSNNDALAEYAAAVQKSPRDWRKNNNFAAALIGQDRYDEAVVFLRRADNSIREKSPHKWIVEFNLAFVLEAVDPGNQESKDLILKAMTRRHKLFDEDWQATVVGDRSIMNRLLNYPEIRGARRAAEEKNFRDR